VEIAQPRRNYFAPETSWRPSRVGAAEQGAWPPSVAYVHAKVCESLRAVSEAPAEAEPQFEILGDQHMPAEAGELGVGRLVKSARGVQATVKLRHVTESEAEQKALLQRLGLKLPRRLKRVSTPVHM